MLRVEDSKQPGDFTLSVNGWYADDSDRHQNEYEKSVQNSGLEKEESKSAEIQDNNQETLKPDISDSMFFAPEHS